MYAMGVSTRAMGDYVQEMYAMEISPAEISRITDSVLPAVQECRNRPLETVYPFIFLDCMFFKVRVNGAVDTRAIYNILGVDIEGKKMYLGFIVQKMKGPICVVHQIRCSMRYVPDRDKKAVMEDMKPIYKANNEEQGYQRLLAFEEKWAKKYPLTCKSWLDNWLNL
ncbi:IS256 family transposase, partial [Elizabethkingia argentiflava]